MSLKIQNDFKVVEGPKIIHPDSYPSLYYIGREVQGKMPAIGHVAYWEYWNHDRWDGRGQGEGFLSLDMANVALVKIKLLGETGV